MASDASMDIVCDFDTHELTNAVDQARKEILVRYDLKDLKVEIDVSDEKITITAQSEMALETVWGIVLQKIINRKLSPQILKKGELMKMGGSNVRIEIKLVKVLDQEIAKIVSNLIREKCPKTKPSIQGETVRVTSKSRDELQGVIAILKTEKSVPLPLKFTNYR